MKILAVGAHLDDIELGCGGTLAKAVDNGHHVRMVVLSESDYTNYKGEVLRTKEQALREGRAAARQLGVLDLVVLDNSTKDIPYHSTVVEQIEAQIDDFMPDLIFTHWTFDTHQAHQGTALSTISAARRHPSILMYEPISPSGRSYIGYRPQMYVDITPSLPKKLESLKAHTSQYEKYGPAWLEAIQARARHRGFEGGYTYAESFEVLRYGLTV
ncbi:MAG: PIG-L deacetylase family protein [Candidatus Sericytochromatia bacterium]